MHQNASIFTIVCLLAFQACTKNEVDPIRAASTASGPVPPVEVHNGAPLNNAAGYPEQARNTSPKQTANAPASVIERTAGATLSPLLGRTARGEVRLEEVAESARPGRD